MKVIISIMLNNLLPNFYCFGYKACLNTRVLAYNVHRGEATRGPNTTCLNLLLLVPLSSEIILPI